MADSNITCSSLAVAGGLGVHVLAWAYSAATVPGAPYPLPYLDLDHFEVWSAATNNRAGATLAAEPRDTKLTVSGLAYSTTRYYWVRAVDKSSNVGDWWPVSATGGVSATTLDKFTGSDLQPNSVPGSVLQVGSITAREMVLTDYTNYVPDSRFLNTMNTWQLLTGWSASASGSGFDTGPNALLFTWTGGVGLSAGASSQQFPVNSDGTYYSSFQVYSAGTFSLTYMVLFYNSAGSYIGGTTLINTGALPTGLYTKVGVPFTPIANAKTALVIFFVDRSLTTANVLIGTPVVRQMANASLIVDGAITATKVTVGTVVADLLVVGGKVITDHVTNNAITNIYSGGTDAQITANNSTTYKTIVTVPSVVVPAGANVQLTFSSSGENGNVCTNQFQILRDATVIATFYGTVISAGGGGSIAYRYMSAYVLLDSPSAGTYDYIVQVRSLSSGGATPEQSNWRYNRGVVSLYKK